MVRRSDVRCSTIITFTLSFVSARQRGQVKKEVRREHFANERVDDRRLFESARATIIPESMTKKFNRSGRSVEPVVSRRCSINNKILELRAISPDRNRMPSNFYLPSQIEVRASEKNTQARNLDNEI